MGTLGLLSRQVLVGLVRRRSFLGTLLNLVVFNLLVLSAAEAANGQEEGASVSQPTPKSELSRSEISESQPEDSLWSQWRGPHRDGFFIGEEWPSSLQEDQLTLSWSRELGPSYSGPVVSEDKVFVTETKNEEFEVVHALDRQTGQTIWTQDWKGSMVVPFFAKKNGSWIRSTPAFDGENLYVAGMRDVLVCLDAEDGTERWRVDFVEKFQTPLPSFGCVSSPLVDDEHVYIQAGAALTKLDKRTGEVVWQSLKDEGGMNGSAFSSPFFATLNEVQQLLVQTREKLTGVRPDDGEVLWEVEVPSFRGMNILTPTVINDRVFTSSYGGKSFLYHPTLGAAEWTCSTAWENRQQGYMSSPIVIADHIYLHLRNQRFTCINAQTGESTWTTKPFGEYWSMLAQGNRILALDSEGELLLLDADPNEFKLVDRRRVGEDCWAHLGLDHGQVFVRSLDSISVYDWKSVADKN